MADSFVYPGGNFALNLGGSGMRRLATTLLVLAMSTIGQANDAIDVRQPAGVVRGNTRFATAPSAGLRGRPGDIFFSPASISTALAMTYAGARDETADQMAATLHFDMPGE